MNDLLCLTGLLALYAATHGLVWAYAALRHKGAR
mgnify:FL=1